MTIRQIATGTLVGLILIGSAGCISIFGEPAEPPQVLHFRLQYPRPQEKKRPRSFVLRILPLRISALYNTDAIVVRNGEHVDRHYNYLRWSAPPARMIGDILSRDLAESGLFEIVIPGPSPLANDYLLNGTVEEIEERADDGNCKAYLRIRFVLARQTSATQATPVFQKAYGAEEECIVGNAGSLVASMSRALQTISERLRADIDEILESSLDSASESPSCTGAARSTRRAASTAADLITS